MRLRYSIATNFDPDLLPGVADAGIAEVYGSITGTPGGTGRPEGALPCVDYQRAAQHILAAHKHGVGFVLLLNSACSGNLEWDKDGAAHINELIDFAVQTGVDAVTVANPMLLAMIKRQARHLPVKISVHAEADTVARIEWWRKWGADIVTLPTRCNRNFTLLRKLSGSLASCVELLANNLCTAHCPLDRYHGQTVGHSACRPVPFPDPCLLLCNLDKLENPYKLLASPWIRPEDIPEYEELGFTRFKLTDRCKSSGWLLRVAAAYVKGSSPEDLMSILNFPSPVGEDERVMDACGWRMPKMSILAGALDGFLQPFLEGTCSSDCSAGGCPHCKSYAAGAVRYDTDEVHAAIDALRMMCQQTFQYDPAGVLI